MNLLFELAQEADAEEILKNIKTIFKNDLEKYGAESLPNLAALSTLRLKNAFQYHVYYKIVLDNKIVGGLHLIPKAESQMYLNLLHVLPEFQGLGIGKKVLSFIEKNHPNVSTWTLDAAADNLKNRSFYEKAGYYKTGENKVSDFLTLFEYKKEILCI